MLLSRQLFRKSQNNGATQNILNQNNTLYASMPLPVEQLLQLKNFKFGERIVQHLSDKYSKVLKTNGSITKIIISKVG